MGSSLEVTVTAPTDPVLLPFFNRQCDAFGLVVAGASDVPEEDVKLVCSLVSEYLDNDEDGEVDDERVSN